jgi:hypothetical protein
MFTQVGLPQFGLIVVVLIVLIISVKRSRFASSAAYRARRDPGSPSTYRFVATRLVQTQKPSVSSADGP